MSVFVLRANINVWTSFLKLLNRQDQFIVHQVCKITLIVAYVFKTMTVVSYWFLWAADGLLSLPCLKVLYIPQTICLSIKKCLNNVNLKLNSFVARSLNLLGLCHIRLYLFILIVDNLFSQSKLEHVFPYCILLEGFMIVPLHPCAEAL